MPHRRPRSRRASIFPYPSPVTAVLALVLLAAAARPGRAEVGLVAPLAFLPPDARSAAMGEACTALTRGPEAVWWNPAALALGRGFRGIPYSRNDRLRPWNDVRFEHFVAALGGGGLGLGATYTRMDLTGRDFAVDAPGDPAPHIPRNRREVGTAALGINLGRFALALPRAARLALGASVRAFRNEAAAAGSAAFDQRGPAGVQGWDVDGSAILTWRLAEPSRPAEEEGRPGITSDLCFGYVAMNALDRKFDTAAGRLPLGRRDRAGAGLTLRIPVHWPLIPWIETAAAFERRGLFLKAGREDRAVDHVGGEISLGGYLAARAGQVRDPLREGPGAKERRFTWGAGAGIPPGSGRILRPGLTLDYADLGDRTSAGRPVKQITLSVRFR